MRRFVSVAVVAAAATLVVSGCTTLLAGKPVSMFADPFRVAGLPATDGPSGLRPDAAAPTRHVDDGNGGQKATLAAQAVSDIQQFWDGASRPALGGNSQPAPPRGSGAPTQSSTRQFCDSETHK